MKVFLAGAFGNLGIEILRELIKEKHEVIAGDLKEKEVSDLKNNYTFVHIDVTKPQTLKGVLDNVDIVISTIGLTSSSKTLNCYDVDYKGNLALLQEAQKANIKKFHYVSVIQCDSEDGKKVPMLHAKYLFEQELIKSGINYVIYRPTGYFYDIVKVFRPYIEKGQMQLLKGYGNIKANVVNCPDFAYFIVEHLNDENKMYEIGGLETYSYLEMTSLCFEAAKKSIKIKWSPKWLFNVLANLPKIKKEGKHDVILFSKFTLSHDLIGKTKIGPSSFKEYIKSSFGEK